MSARNVMTHRTTIRRDTTHGGAGEDPYGGDGVPTWTTTTTGDVSCRFWHESTRTVMDGNEATEVEVRKVMLPVGTDVTEDDQLGDVRDRRGRLIAQGPMRIDGLGRRLDHIIVTSVVVR